MDEPRSANLWILWGAMVVSQLVIGCVGLFLHLTGQRAPAEGREFITLVLCGMALGNAGFSFAAGRFVKADFQSDRIVRWAFAESTLLLGFVATWLSGSTLPLTGLLALSLVLLAAHAPTDSARERWHAARSDR